MRTGIHAFVLAVWVGSAGLTGLASGTVPAGGVPRAPLRADAGKIELGRAIYTGKANLSAGAGPVEEQSKRLQALQAKLPLTARKSVDLPALAGKLSAEQLAALETYLAVRFDLKLSNP
jgi:hypothetical protein